MSQDQRADSSGIGGFTLEDIGAVVALDGTARPSHLGQCRRRCGRADPDHWLDPNPQASGNFNDMSVELFTIGDRVQDFNAADGDILTGGPAGATRSQFQINCNTTPLAEQAGVGEAIVIYRPTGQIYDLVA
ncbi:MAG: hypothetical protein WAT09_13495 [Paracoccaceae bacterium]